MRKFFRTLFLLAMLALMAFAVYTQIIQPKETEQKVAKDIGKVELSEEDFKANKEEVKKYEAKSDYTERFEDWDDLNAYATEGEVYALPQHPDKVLYLMYASKQEDGSIKATFTEEKSESKE